MIRGADVLLYVRTKNGEDEFHAPVWRETPVTVHNVLIGEPDADAVVSDLQLCGRRLAYVLAIPKGDTNDWDGVTVEFFGRKWRTYGGVTEGIEELLPLAWNKKVKVERYDTTCSHFPANTFGGNSRGKYLYTTTQLMSKYFPDANALNAYLVAQYVAGSPVQVYYNLTEPVPFTATGAQPIPALAGANTVLTDADSVTVTGRADPIKRITDLEAAVASIN